MLFTNLIFKHIKNVLLSHRIGGSRPALCALDDHTETSLGLAEKVNLSHSQYYGFH